MGGDGGSVPKRKERVKTTRQPKKVRDNELDANERWKICPISGYFIRKPVMAGHYGDILSKEGVLEYLIKKGQDLLEAYHIAEDTAPICNTLHSLKDVKELNLKDNPALNKDNPSEEEWKKGDFVCPITGLETNGKHKFVFSWRCGCVVSERALKECMSEEERNSMEKRKCLVCEKTYNPWDLVLINTTTHKELDDNQARFLARKMLPVFKSTTGLTNPSGIAGETDEEGGSSQGSAKAASSSSEARSRDREDGRPSASRATRGEKSNSGGPSTSQSRASGDNESSSHSKRDRSQTPHGESSTSTSRSQSKRHK